MRHLLITVTLLVQACASPPDAAGEKVIPQGQQAFFERSAARAVASQGALLPHHFRSRSELLTPLGERDLDTLFDLVLSEQIPIVVVRGDAPPELANRRLESIRSRVREAGLDGDALVAFGFPGGRGRAASETKNAPTAAGSALLSRMGNQE